LPDPLRHVRALAEEIGPRAAAGPAEARAARYIAEAARGYTHQVWLEPFPTFVSAAAARLLVGGLSLCGGLLVWAAPEAAAAVSGVAAASLLGQALRWIELGWLFRRGKSQNVVTVVPSAGSIRRRLIIVAHYDSAAAPPLAPAVAWLTSAGVFLLPVLLFGYLFSGAAVWQWLSLPLMALVAVGILLSHGRQSTGGGESAAGVAVALAAGEALARVPLRHTEVWTVFTGAREPGMVGLRALLQRYSHMLKDADFLVLDRLGRGELIYSVTEGIFPMRACGGALLEALGEMAADHPEWGLNGTCLKGLDTQSGLLLDSGYQAATLLTRAGGRPSLRTLDTAVKVLRAVGDRIDRDACAEAEAEAAEP
jgi:hypothetical protein